MYMTVTNLLAQLLALPLAHLPALPLAHPEA